MSNIEIPKRILTPVSSRDDVREAVDLYKTGIQVIKSSGRKTKWRPYTANEIQEIAASPDSNLLLMRREVDGMPVGNVEGGTLVDQDFAAWSPQEVTHDTLHFGKFITIEKHLGRSGLWPALLEYGKANGYTTFIAEAWDFSYGEDGLEDDKLLEFYMSLGMEHHGTVIYKNGYYGQQIGDEQPVNRLMYTLDTPPESEQKNSLNLIP
jgi:hypothetical protein